MLRENEKTRAGDLRGCLDGKAIQEALLQPRKQSRLYAYCCIVRDACSRCFRVYGGDVYGYDGKVWKVIDGRDLPDIVEDAFIGCAGGGLGGEIARGDWLMSEKKILDYAWKGILRSRLEVSPSVVGFVNGVWDFGDVDNPVGYGFDSRMPVRSLLPYKYDPDATCPCWMSFLKMMLPSSDIRILQKFFGLGIVGRNVLGRRIEESLWLIGDGANGKSTIQDVMRGVFGNVSSTRLDALLDRNIDARMRSVALIEGKIFNMCEEISDADIERGGDMFKSLVSGSPQSARSLSKDIWEVTDIPYFVFSMNQKPSNKKMDDAFRRRMVTIDFRSSVRPEDMDRGLGTRLVKEYSGIRNWAIEGFRLLVEDGYTTKTVRKGEDELYDDEEIDTMISNELTVDVWKNAFGLSASKHVGHDVDEVGLWVRATDLRNDYSDFCSNRLGCTPVTSNQFGRDMHRLHFESKRQAGGTMYKIYCKPDNMYNKRKD